MGLDVYLYRCPDRATAKAAEDKCEAESELQWELVAPGVAYEAMTAGQKEEARSRGEKIAAELGCAGEYGQHHTVTKIDQPSALHPEHLFRVGYFRSSYNDGGIERVLGNLGIGGLHEMFEPEDRYEFTPDWLRARLCCEESIEKYKATLSSSIAGFAVSEIRANMFSDPAKLPHSSEEAMEIVRKESPKWAQRTYESGTGYGNRDGEFFPSGRKVVALIPGAQESIMAKMRGTRALESVMYVVTAPDKETPAKDDWYLQALEIVKETCDFVLSKPDPQSYYVHWSG